MKVKLVKKRSIKKIDYRHFIAIFITLTFLLLSIFVYKNSFIRLKESLIDIWTSLQCYVNSFTDNSLNVEPTVVNISNLDITIFFPFTWEEFKVLLGVWWQKLWTKENLLLYLEKFSNVYLILMTILELLIIVWFLVSSKITKHLQMHNNDYACESKKLIKFKRFERKCAPIIAWFKDTYTFFNLKTYTQIWLLIWLYNLNFFNILIEFLAYYFYLVATFDFANIFTQIYKLVFDIALTLNGLPWYVWIVIFSVILVKWRTKKGYDKLEHFENYDSGFVKELPTVNVVYGLMGGGKGQIMTDIVLTKGKLMRADALETMQKFDRMFPYFPFILVEQTIKKLRKEHKVYSLATVEQYIKKRRKWFEHAVKINCPISARYVLWRYDYINCGLEYDNNMYMVHIFDAIEEYAKAYYIYTTVEFNITNYAIRSDGILQDYGNLPLWDFDFFHRNSGEIYKISRYGKILDQDILRRGKKVNPDNPFADTLEFGIVVMTELDKERGNQFVEKEMKINDEETNQKNDLFNYGLKLDRHPSTVDFKHYMFLIFDLQRLGSTNADLQECGQHLGVGKKDKKEFAMPLFFIEEFLYGLFKGFYDKFYAESRFYHGDNTLLIHLVKKLLGGFYNYYDKMYNLFGYDKHYLQIEDLRTHTFSEHPYYYCYKKTNALRYYTDSLVDFFRQSALKRNVGIDDYPEYKGVKATREELSMQNSYFQNKLNNVFSSEDTPENKGVDERSEIVKTLNKLQLKKPSIDGNS